MNVGPMLNGHDREELVGAGVVVWKAEKQYASKKMELDQLVSVVSSGYVYNFKDAGYNYGG
jgi:hypothetical protein